MVIGGDKNTKKTLSKTEVVELEKVRDHHKKPYMREKASALLKVASGQSANSVALNGLHKTRDPDTVYSWLDIYEAEGIAELLIKKGRGRKPAFSPEYKKESEAKQAILIVIRRDPQQFGYKRSRWTLKMINESYPWLTLESASGLFQLLKRLKISYKRGRDYVHSPDPYYMEKLSLIELMRFRAYYNPKRYVFLYLDELTYYRQPTLARAYECAGKIQPLAQRSHRSNTSYRALAALNVMTGQVSYRQRSRTNISCLIDFWYELCEDYSDVEIIYVAEDNWPVHYHPDVLAPLQPQNFPFPPRLPDNWPTEPTSKAKLDILPIQILSLPTYASWLNPIEKLWRWLKQEILHLHRLSDEWADLKERVDQFLAAFSSGSNELLHYVGLLPI
ncbi:MAG: IS630 family transposase [Chloroflexota bacterium]|nr:MAG: IS630 family transposase [Chloroflexota bacterium]